jgi:hypothetical protein
MEDKILYITENDIKAIVVEATTELLKRAALDEDRDAVSDIDFGGEIDGGMAEQVSNFPVWAIHYAAYGEADGLEDEDAKLVDRWMDENGFSHLVDASDETNFSSHPVFGLACDCVEWATFEKK